MAFHSALNSKVNSVKDIVQQIEEKIVASYNRSQDDDRPMTLSSRTTSPQSELHSRASGLQLRTSCISPTANITAEEGILKPYDAPVQLASENITVILCPESLPLPISLAADSAADSFERHPNLTDASLFHISSGKKHYSFDDSDRSDLINPILDIPTRRQSERSIGTQAIKNPLIEISSPRSCRGSSDTSLRSERSYTKSLLRTSSEIVQGNLHDGTPTTPSETSLEMVTASETPSNERAERSELSYDGAGFKPPHTCKPHTCQSSSFATKEVPKALVASPIPSTDAGLPTAKPDGFPSASAIADASEITTAPEGLPDVPNTPDVPVPDISAPEIPNIPTDVTGQLPAPGTPNTDDKSSKGKKVILKGKKAIRRGRRIILRKPVLSIVIGRQLAGPVADAIKLISKDLPIGPVADAAGAAPVPVPL